MYCIKRSAIHSQFNKIIKKDSIIVCGIIILPLKSINQNKLELNLEKYVIG